MLSRTFRFLPPLALGALVCSSIVARTARAEDLPPEHWVHRFMDIAVSSHGALVASIEGDAPRGASTPVVRDLVIRQTSSGAAVTVDLPCGRVPQCWPGAPAWTPDGHRLTFTLRTPGAHTYDLYGVDPDGAHLAKLLAFDGTMRSLKYAPDGRLALLATAHAVKESGATEAGAPIAGDLDIAPAEQRIAVVVGATLQFASPADLYVYEYDWRPGTTGFVGTAAPGDGDDHWWNAKLYAFSQGSSHVIFTPVDSRQQLAEPKVSPDGRSVAFIAGIMSDFGSTGGDVYRLALGKGAPGEGAALNLTRGMQASATSLAWSCGGTLRVALLAGDSMELDDFGLGRTVVNPHRLWKGTETLRGPDAGVSAACRSTLTATVHETFTAPPEIEVGDIGSWRDLTQVNRGLSMPLQAQSLTWHSEGFEVQGWLLLPTHATGKLPLITMIHGGPAAAAEPSFAGPGLMSALAAKGYAILMPNPRGSFGRGERFTQANVRDFGHGDLRDVLAGIDAAEHAAPLDEARLGITGGSYGGFMTMWSVTQTNRFKAAVAGAGISNWLSYYGENGIDGWMLPYFGASAYEDPAIYANSSAIAYIRNVRTPTFAWAGERDIECPPSQTQEFWHALKTLGIPTSIMIYPGEGHGLRDPQHAADAVERTVAWFDRYLTDEPAR